MADQYRRVRPVFVLMIASVLAACGGGDGSDDPTAGLTGPPASTTPPEDTKPPVTPPPETTPPVVSNQAPTIAGKPGTSVVAGQSYSFAPSAKDPEGDKLKFSIASKPGWAKFDAATGKLSGTPATADVGSHEDIVISVTDGHSEAKLPQFVVNVAAPASPTVTLAWTPPTESVDGAPLTKLSGYKIYYGNKSGNYTKTITLTNPGITRYVVENLSPGQYYFAITATTNGGPESDYSPEVSKKIS